MKWDYWVGQDESSVHIADQLSNEIIKVERGTDDPGQGFWDGPFTFNEAKNFQRAEIKEVIRRGKFLLPRVGKIRAAHIHDYTPHYEEWD